MPPEQQPTPVPDGSTGEEQSGPEALLRAQAAELAALRALVQELPEDLAELQADAARWRELAPQLPQLRQQIEAGIEAERQALEQQRQGIEAERLDFQLERSALAAGVRPEMLDLFMGQFRRHVRIEDGQLVMQLGEEVGPAAAMIESLPDRPEHERMAFLFKPRMGSGSGGVRGTSSPGRINTGSAAFQQMSPAQKIHAVFGNVPGN